MLGMWYGLPVFQLPETVMVVRTVDYLVGDVTKFSILPAYSSFVVVLKRWEGTNARKDCCFIRSSVVLV